MVAADKGTATFSDIANGVAEDYGFWLGDAFASGGSAGYDHKAMGITARGAWESVKRHFREIGKDIQTRAVHRGRAWATCRATCSATACCCRGRSGCAPPSTTATSFSTPIPTRRRPGPSASACSTCRAPPGRTTTAALISAGGGVWPRTLKSIPLSPNRCKALLDLKADALAPGGADPRHPQEPGRTALSRRHRHLCEGGRARPTSTWATRPMTPCGSTAGTCAARWSARAPTWASPRPAGSSSPWRAGGSTPTPSTIPPASTPPTTR